MISRSSTPDKAVLPDPETTLNLTSKLLLVVVTLEAGRVSSTLCVVSLPLPKPRSNPLETMLRFQAMPLVVVPSSSVVLPTKGPSSMTSPFSSTKNLSPEAQSSIWYSRKVTLTLCSMSSVPNSAIGNTLETSAAVALVTDKNWDKLPEDWRRPLAKADSDPAASKLSLLITSTTGAQAKVGLSLGAADAEGPELGALLGDAERLGLELKLGRALGLTDVLGLELVLGVPEGAAERLGAELG